MGAALVRIAVVSTLGIAAVAMLQSSAAPRASAPAVSLPASAAATVASRTAAPAATPRPTPTAFSLTVSDSDLTKAAASSFPQTVSGVTVSDPDVRVESGGVRLTAKARVFFGTTQFVMIATPTVESGRVAVRVDSATLGGLSLPSDTKASIADTIQTTIGRLVPSNVRVTTINMTPGTLTVQGIQP